MKRGILVVMCFLSIALLIPFWTDFIAKLEENEPLSRFISVLYDIPLDEPSEYLYQYSKESDYVSLNIYYMDVSDWDAQKVLCLFPKPKEISGEDGILHDCKLNLRFRGDEELGVLED